MSNNPIADTGGVFDKVDILNDACSQLRISGLTVQPTPEDLELSLMRLEDLAAMWSSRNICANYNFEDEPDPNSLSNVPRWAKSAFATNLAVRLIPDFNKEVPQKLMDLARGDLNNLSGRCAMERINDVPYPTRQPRGFGNTLRYSRWARFYRNQGFAPNSCDTKYMVEDDINDFTEHFDSYLNDSETIASFSIIADPALDVQSSSNTDTDVTYRIKAGGTSNTAPLNNQQLTIIVTTSDGRVETRFIYFNITPKPRNN